MIGFAVPTPRTHDTGGAAVAPTPSAVPRPFDALEAALQDTARRVAVDDARAEALLAALMDELADHPDPRCVGLLVFAAGLAQRLAGRSRAQANLYLRRYEVPQIHLFNLLGRAVPFVGMATQFCNQALMRAMAGQAHPALIDVGIGTGRQAALLLDSLAEAGQLPRRLTVVGIEPSDWALDAARRTLEASAQRLGVALCFLGITSAVEDMDDAAWHRLAEVCTAAPVVNASFALHHIADDGHGRDRRDAVLARLHALQPAALVLAEPDSDHLEPRFLQRFQNCVRHFSTVFRILDGLPLATDERNALKAGFFGREIADILGGPDGQRSERHESAASWSVRLRRAGFVPAPALAGASPLRVTGTSGVTHRQRLGHSSLDAGDEPVVALFATCPRVMAQRRPASVDDGLLAA